MDREEYMELALALAREAGNAGEVPVGCVIADANGKIIGSGRNRREEEHDASAHAEIEAIRMACDAVGDWRLSGCTIFVTLEPCPMCAGAIINARVERVVYGAYDKKAGSFGTMLDLTNYPLYKPEIEGGVLSDECSAILSEFFKAKR